MWQHKLIYVFRCSIFLCVWIEFFLDIENIHQKVERKYCKFVFFWICSCCLNVFVQRPSDCHFTAASYNYSRNSHAVRTFIISSFSAHLKPSSLLISLFSIDMYISFSLSHSCWLHFVKMIRFNWNSLYKLCINDSLWLNLVRC